MELSREEVLNGNKVIQSFMLGFEVDSAVAFKLHFHDSWDWIHPVIDKINGMGKEYNFTIFKTYVALSVEKSNIKIGKDFHFAYSEYITSEQTGKVAAFKLIVKFIEWYHENILSKNLVESK